MKKYFTTFLLGLETHLQYRANLITYLFVQTIPSVVFIVVWFNILGERSSIGSFSRNDFVLYYLFVTLSWYIVGGVFASRISEGIRMGTINRTLVKPYSLVLAEIFREQAWKFSSILLALPGALFAGTFFRSFINIKLSGFEVLVFLVTLLLGMFIFIFFQAALGMTAFWFIDTWILEVFFDFVRWIFGGLVIPIALMPEILQKVSSFLPFKYVFYTPASVLIGIDENIPVNIAIQIGYLLFFFVLYKVLWHYGIKRYEAVGG